MIEARLVRDAGIVEALPSGRLATVDPERRADHPVKVGVRRFPLAGRATAMARLAQPPGRPA